MARRQGHFVNFSHIPGRDNHPAGIRIVFDSFYHIGQLVYSPPVWCRPTSPLVTIDRSQVPVFICPFIPDRHSVVLEIFDISISGNEPKQFVYYGFEMHFLGGQKRETLTQVKSHLIAEYAFGSHSGAVGLDYSVFLYVTQKVQVLFHNDNYLTENAKMMACW